MKNIFTIEKQNTQKHTTLNRWWEKLLIMGKLLTEWFIIELQGPRKGILFSQGIWESGKEVEKEEATHTDNR